MNRLKGQARYCKECYHYGPYIPTREERKDSSSIWYKWRKCKPTYTYCSLLKKLHANDIQPDPNDRACEFFKFKPGYRNNNHNEIDIES